VSPDSFQLFSSHQTHQLEVAGVRLHQQTSIRPAFDYVCDAKCLIANDEDPWLEESKLLGIPAIFVTPDLTLEPCAEKVTTAQGLGRDDSNLARFKRSIGATVLSVRPPEYWDSGTATRIAGQLITLQAKADDKRDAALPHGIQNVTVV
jgi:hypothetical protein